MARKENNRLDQDQAWPVLAWLLVKYEQEALSTIFSDDADPALPTMEKQLELADEFLAVARPCKEALESWLGNPGSAKVSSFINDMIMHVAGGIHLAKEWRLVVKDSEARRASDKVINESWICLVFSFLSESYERNILNDRKRVAALQRKWQREKERLYKRGAKLFLKRQAITSDLMKRKVIGTIPSDEQMIRFESPPEI